MASTPPPPRDAVDRTFVPMPEATAYTHTNGNGTSERGSSPPSSVRSAVSSGKIPVIDRYHKRGRVESAGYESTSSGLSSPHHGGVHSRIHASTDIMRDRFGSPHAGITIARRRAVPARSTSMPNMHLDRHDEDATHYFFPDVNPRELRLAEVRSWQCAWMQRDFTGGAPPPSQPTSSSHVDTASKPTTSNDVADFDSEIHAISHQFSLEDKRPATPIQTPPPSAVKSVKRPTLRLKLEDMPTPQQAEDRAQRAASRIIARREAMEKALAEAPAEDGKSTSASQQAIMRLNFKSYSSGDESDAASPNGRHSVGSAYSPNHGMFTTKNVAISEAGISSPDTPSLHLQENLERVREIGRGASGVVYKAIHIPTLKVVAIKDVPVYGRGQRRQMVRELHALYSNLVPMAVDEDIAAKPGDRPRRQSNGKPRASPHIVSFYDAFVDRAKNCICLVMEYMNAGSLQDIVLRGGCQNEKVLSRLAAGVLQGLSHIHKKRMVHRDIKPHNLLANRNGDVKISDFGLAKTLSDNAGMTKTFVGTLLYMAPERIGGGDYSYPADVWSFGLVMVSVALGKYPLPTQDGFFGLVDSVANEKCLELPAETFSQECRDFTQQCLRVDPAERPSADVLLSHPFITKYSSDETYSEWLKFIESAQLCEEKESELDSLGEAVYRHIYDRSVQFSSQPQSDYGVSFATQTAPFHRREVSIHPVQMSLQLGLANYLGVPVHTVYEIFETKRGFYSDKLLEEYCYSPQSWAASPGIARRQQLFGSDSESPQHKGDNSRSSSFWKKLQDGLTKFKSKRKKGKEGKENGGDRLSSYTSSR